MPLITKHDKKNYINKMELKIRLATSKTSEEKIINELFEAETKATIKSKQPSPNTQKIYISSQLPKLNITVRKARK